MRLRKFDIAEFKTMMLRLLNASNAHDGIELQKMAAEIENVYQRATMSTKEHGALMSTCLILLDDWRKNYK